MGYLRDLWLLLPVLTDIFGFYTCIFGLKANKKLGDACTYMKDKVSDEVRIDRGEQQTPVIGSHWEGDDLVISVPPARPAPGLPEDQPVVAKPPTKPVETASKSVKGTPGKAAAVTTASKSAGGVVKKSAPTATKAAH